MPSLKKIWRAVGEMGNVTGLQLGEAFIRAQRRSFRLATLATVEGGITASVERKVKSKGGE